MQDKLQIRNNKEEGESKEKIKEEKKVYKEGRMAQNKE